MATHSFEFIFGVICLAGGGLSRFVWWFLKTRRSDAMREADEALVKDGLSGVTVLDAFRFGAVLMLLLGGLLLGISIIAYAGF